MCACMCMCVEFLCVCGATKMFNLRYDRDRIKKISRLDFRFRDCSKTFRRKRLGRARHVRNKRPHQVYDLTQFAMLPSVTFSPSCSTAIVWRACLVPSSCLIATSFLSQIIRMHRFNYAHSHRSQVSSLYLQRSTPSPRASPPTGFDKRNFLEGICVMCGIESSRMTWSIKFW